MEIDVFMKISIITVSFNAVETIEQTISSVVNQSASANIEYIVIDGGSTDGTVNIINKYSPQIAYWISEKDAGIYDAMNKGVKIASGDYIQIIGADDCLIDKDIIKRVIVDLENNDGVDIFSAGIILVDEKFKCERYAGNESARNRMIGMPWMPHPGLFVKTSLMKKTLFDVKYKIAADLKFILEKYYDSNTNFVYVDYPVTYFSSGGVSSTQRRKANEENQEILKELNINLNIATQKNIYIFIRTVFVRMLSYLHILGFVKIHLFGWKKHCCKNKICRWCE